MNSVLPKSLATADAAAPSRILLVEGGRAVGALLKARMEALDGVVGELVHNLSEARRLLAADSGGYLAAVVGLNLPDAPNGEIVGVVQRAGLPVIVLTGHLDESRREQMFKRGVADYVVKDSASGIDYVARLVDRMRRNRDMQILVVDDSAAFRDYLANLLRQHGYQTLTAVDGHDGLRVMQQNPAVRLVVTDYLMPRMDGLEMTVQMRKLRDTEELAIIGVSETAKAGVLARFLKSGASDYLRKPFCVEEFYCRVDQNIDMLDAIQQARELASRDFLTRLYNRRSFFEFAQQRYDQAMRDGARILVAMIDADRFKSINDTFGHKAGDEALVAIAATLAGLAGDDGLVARFGGEEFALLSVLDPGEQPETALEALRSGVEQVRLHSGGERVPISASIGATLEAGGGLTQMLALADRAVYQAKQQGRNRVVIL